MAEPAHTGVVLSIGGGLFALFAGLFKWALGRQVQRIDRLEANAQEVTERVATVERTAISQAGVDLSVRRLEDALTRHSTSVDASMRELHKRNDRLFELLAARRRDDQ